MNTYQLYPELRRILEDKRIRQVGLPDGVYENYLLAEQFVLDLRTMDAEELNQVIDTFEDLKKMNLHKNPHDFFVLHVIFGEVEVSSYFFDDKSYMYPLADNEEMMKFYLLKAKADKNLKKTVDETGIMGWQKLIVLLATRGIIKEHHDPRKPQKKGKSHKRGSGGYTIIRPPEAYEIAGGTHASPRPHFRRGHIRKYHPEDKTQWIWIDPCFVNGTPEIQRTSYLVKENV